MDSWLSLPHINQTQIIKKSYYRKTKTEKYQNYDKNPRVCKSKLKLI